MSLFVFFYLHFVKPALCNKLVFSVPPDHTSDKKDMGNREGREDEFEDSFHFKIKSLGMDILNMMFI